MIMFNPACFNPVSRLRGMKWNAAFGFGFRRLILFLKKAVASMLPNVMVVCVRFCLAHTLIQSTKVNWQN